MSKVIVRNINKPCPNAIFFLQLQFIRGVLHTRWAEVVPPSEVQCCATRPGDREQGELSLESALITQRSQF